MPGEVRTDRDSSRPLDELLDNAPCGFLSFADDGTITRANTTLLAMLGQQHDELVGHRIEAILNIGSRIFYQTHWFPLLRMSGAAEEIFLMLRTAAGEDVGVLVNAVRRERDGGAEYDCVLIRVRERQKYETELLRARRTAEDAHTEVEAQRAELQRANGILQQQAVELTQQQKRLEEQAIELEASGEELRMLNDVLLDRTQELERAREVADDASAAKTSFLAVMSHELRTPLNAIAGYVDLIDMGIQGPVTDKQRDALDRIRRAQRHLLRLINDILNLSRIEAGRVEYDLEEVPLGLVVDDVRAMVEPQLSDKALRFDVTAPYDIVAHADREKVQQILLNLLSNAIKFTPQGGSVSVTAELPENASDQVLLRVSDTGIGIPATQLDRVFEPFVQVETSIASTREGTGLGLAISRDLARGMKGDLHAVSTEGKGSTFTLTLPRAR
jgi:signal transduction histidine kinase